VLAGNGRVMLQSEGVQSKAQAVRTAHDLRDDLMGAPIRVLQETE